MRGATRAAFVGLVVLSVLNYARPEWFAPYQVDVLYLLVGALGFARFGRRPVPADDVDTMRAATVGHVLVVAGLVGLSIRLFVDDAVLDPVRGPAVALVFVALVAYPLCQHDPREFVDAKAPYVFALGLVLWGHLVHALSTGHEFPIFVGIVLVLGLLVVPRYVAFETFCWTIAGVSAVAVAAGFAAHVVGEYTVAGLTVSLWSGYFSPVFVDGSVRPIMSVFSNPNGLGILAFAGAVASLALAGRGLGGPDGRGERLVRLRERPVRVALATALLGVNAVGLYFTDSRASLLAAGVAGGLYLTALALGRRSIPLAVPALLAGVGGFLVAMRFGWVTVSSTGRFQLWEATVRALLADPRPFGHGIVDPGEVVAPYVEPERLRGYSPHNSYLVVFVRAGLFGGLAYLGLTLGSVLDGAVRYRSVNAAALALALGFAVHQLFESYSLVQYYLPSVLATLAFGYLVVDGVSVVDE